MKKGLTELVFILDKSGSMGGLTDDTIGGFNAMLEKQKKVDGECRVTTVLFNHDNQLLHDRIDIRAIRPLTEQDYFVGGSTALFDAVGATIHKIINAQKHTEEEYRAEKVMFVIITDGQENASREYPGEKVKALVEQQKEKYGWEFVFLGANIDAVEAAGQVGIRADRAANYVADAKGTSLNFEVVGDVVVGFRKNRTVSAGCLDRIRQDAQLRGAESENGRSAGDGKKKFFSGMR